MKATVYLSRKLLNQLKVKETESKDLMLTHNLHNIIINGKRVGCYESEIEMMKAGGTYDAFVKRVYDAIDWSHLFERIAQMENEAITAAIDKLSDSMI